MIPWTHNWTDPRLHPWLTVALVSYLLGSIPFGYLLVRVFRHQDIRSTGSGNIGATNVARSGSTFLALATLLLDTLKGTAAVLLAFSLARHVLTPRTATANARAFAFSLASEAAAFVILGHIFPLWLGLRGGKGVATALGAFAVLSPRSVACALAVFLAIFALTRFVSLASILAAAVLPLAFLAFVPSRASWPTAAFLGIPLLIIAKHNANIRRLLAGTESRFGRSASPERRLHESHRHPRRRSLGNRPRHLPRPSRRPRRPPLVTLPRAHPRAQ